VLDYWQAVEAARDRMKARAAAAAGKIGPYTIDNAITAYVEFLKRERKSSYQVSVRAYAHILPSLGDVEVVKLTADGLRRWHSALAEQPARLRSRKGQQNFRPLPSDDEAVRRRRASANVCLAQLKAALNLAFQEGKAPSDSAWRKVKPFRAVNLARNRYLSIDECKRLIEACTPDFRNLVRGALETGARYGELTRMTVGDYNADVGTVSIWISKTKPRHVVLTDEGVSFFDSLCASRGKSDPIFKRADGTAWGRCHQAKPMLAACRVAKNLGHVDTRMVEKHYGHLAPSYVADAIRHHAPKFGTISSA